MTENKTPDAAPGNPGGSAQAPTQPFNWLPIIGFVGIAAALIAGAYYFLM